MSATIDTGVTNALKNDAQLQVLAPGGIYRDVAPESVVRSALSDPAQVFGIVTLQSETQAQGFADTTGLQEARYLVKFVSPSTSPSGAQSALDRALTVLRAFRGTVVSGFAISASRQEERVAYVEQDGAIAWQHRGVSWLLVSSAS